MAYEFSSNVIGAGPIGAYTTTAPGIAVLPGVPLEPQLGEIRSAWDATLGWAEFIYLKVPVSTAITAGLVYQWSGNYSVAVLPVLATSKNTGHQVAVAVTALTSDSANVNYGWFQISGLGTVLKTAVQSLPDAKVYASGTAGRVKMLTSAGGEITGMRTAFTSGTGTVTSTTSTITVYMNRPALQGQIT
jgi:hypothetical protein